MHQSMIKSIASLALVAVCPVMATAGLPGLEDRGSGLWNISVGSAEDRTKAAEYFGVRASGDESLWLNNVMSPFIGKTLKMTAIHILQRNAFNTVIELSVNTGTVLWTIGAFPQGVCGDWVEHINGAYTGTAFTAGYVSSTKWVENDHKSIIGMSVANDWGIAEVLSASGTTVVIKYWSYKKGKFIMTWSLQNETGAGSSVFHV